MGSNISLLKSRKSKSSKRLHSSKDNRLFLSKIAASKSSSRIASLSTPSALPSGSNDSISGFSDVATTQLTLSNSTNSVDASTVEQQNISSNTCQSSSAASTASSYSDCQVSTAVSSTKCFFDASTCQRQSFAFPTPIMEYIAMNPSSTKVYQKLIQTCKYFFARNPILVIPSLINWHCDDAWHDESPVPKCTCSWPDHRDGWEISYLQEKKEIVDPCDLFLKDVSKNIKIWPTEYMLLHDFAPENSSAITVSSIIPRFYRCDVSMLFIFGPELSLDELKLLAANVEGLQCRWPFVKDKNGAYLSLKDIIAVFPELKQMLCSIQRVRFISPEEVLELADIPQFQNFVEYHFARNPDAFDINEFCEFMIQNKNIEYELSFYPYIDQNLKDRIQACKERLSNEVFENGQKRPEITVMEEEDDDEEEEVPAVDFANEPDALPALAHENEINA